MLSHIKKIKNYINTADDHSNIAETNLLNLDYQPKRTQFGSQIK